MIEYFTSKINEKGVKMKRLKKALSVILVMCFVFQAVCVSAFAKEGTANVPYDIYGHWGQDYIYSLIDSGIIKGYEDQTFRPNNSITRAEFCTLVIETLVKRNGIEYSETRGTFKDVSDKDWYAKYVETAVELGIVGGVGDGYFDPNGKMNREQLAKMMSDVYCLEKEVSFEEISSPEDSYKDFKDSKDMSDWAFKYISAAYNAGLMQGKENGFEPKSSTTRAEAATIIYRLFGFTKVDIPYTKPVRLDSFISALSDYSGYEIALENINDPDLPGYNFCIYVDGEDYYDALYYDDKAFFQILISSIEIGGVQYINYMNVTIGNDYYDYDKARDIVVFKNIIRDIFGLAGIYISDSVFNEVNYNEVFADGYIKDYRNILYKNNVGYGINGSSDYNMIVFEVGYIVDVG